MTGRTSRDELMNSQFHSQQERGSALVLTMVLSTVILLVGLSLAFVATAEIRVSAADRDRKAARYVAEQGLKDAEDALFSSWGTNRWLDDLDAAGGLGRPAHEAGDQPPLSLGDRSLNRNGLVVYRWNPATPGEVLGTLYRVPLNLRGGNARYTVWVRNNSDDFGSAVTADGDSIVEIIALGEVLDAEGGVRSRSFLSETISLEGTSTRNYSQKGLGAGGTSTIEE